MDVINRLRVKFIVTTVIILTLVFSVLFFIVNVITTRETNMKVLKQMQELVDADGFMIQKKIMGGHQANQDQQTQPEGMRNMEDRFMFYQFQQPFNMENIRNYFSVRIGSNSRIMEIVSPYPLHYTDDEVTALVDTVMEGDVRAGVYQGLGFKVVSKPYGYLAVFIDIQQEANIHSMVFKITTYTYVGSLIVSIIIAWFLSSWAVKPVRTAFEKQKRFVADASHELKTPLSVISANLDVLKGETGENKWIDYIGSEVNRMSKLVKDLLYLAKCDNETNKYTFTEFNLSRAVMNSVLPFEVTIFEQEKVLETDIAEELSYVGDENAIRQIVVILLDNAVKHTDKGAVISVKLYATGNKKTLSIRNTGAGISEKDQKKIFERFFRVDSSRNRDTGGYGLGLSIAKSIADMHHAKLTVSSVEGEYAEFTLHM